MRARPGRWVLSGATVAVGLGVLEVVVHDGSPGWQVLRGLVVVAATVLLAGVVWSGGTAGGWAGAAVGLAGILVGGGIGVRHVVMDGVSVEAGAGLVALAAGVVLLGGSAWGLLRGARWWRWAVALPVGLVVVALVGLVVVPALVATNVPPTSSGAVTPADHGLDYEDVRLVTDDGVELAGWYIPSGNGAAVVVRHGVGSTRADALDQAGVLADAGRMQGIPGHGSQRWYQCPQRHTQRYSDTARCECRRLHAATVEEAVWQQVTSLLGDPAALEALAGETESTRGQHAAAEREQLDALDSRIATLENQIADEYAGLRAEGVDPATARAAIRASNELLLNLRRQRNDLRRLRGKNLATAGLTNRLRALCEQARGALNAADDGLRRRLIELLDLRVEVMGWTPCDMCGAKGLIRTTNEVRRQGNTGVVCPDCLRTRHVPALRVTGQIPELLLAALGHGGEVRELPSERVGAVLPFEADVRIA
jgi:hypothetical protein